MRLPRAGGDQHPVFADRLERIIFNLFGFQHPAFSSHDTSEIS
jgi:hypothetical protein